MLSLVRHDGKNRELVDLHVPVRPGEAKVLVAGGPGSRASEDVEQRVTPFCLRAAAGSFGGARD